MEHRRYTRHEPHISHANRRSSEDMIFNLSYPSTPRQESPEPLLPSAGDVNHLPNYRYPIPRDGHFQPLPQVSRYGYGGAHVTTGHAPESFHSHGGTGWPGGQPTPATRYPSLALPADTLPNVRRYPSAQQISAWLASQPFPASDEPPVHRTGPVTAPSFEHSGMAQSYEPQYTYSAAYERNHVPTWRESQRSGEFRRQEMDVRVLHADYVRVSSPQGRGSQSSGSAHSFSSSGATAGSCGWPGQDVTSECEFCGRRELLSTIKDHWLSCPHRSAVPPSRRGVWMNR